VVVFWFLLCNWLFNLCPPKEENSWDLHGWVWCQDNLPESWIASITLKELVNPFPCVSGIHFGSWWCPLYKLELSDTGHLKVYPWKYDIQRLPKGRFYI
jgi:hypothetical protein